jgi:hypothetical protein
MRQSKCHGLLSHRCRAKRLATYPQLRWQEMSGTLPSPVIETRSFAPSSHIPG